MAVDLETLSSRAEIEDLIKRWCRAIDRLDFDGIRHVFHPDAHDDHGTYKGNVDGLVEWIRNRHQSIPFSMHMVSNCLIEFRSKDEAMVETYCIAIQRYPAEASSALENLLGKLDGMQGRTVDMTISCRYVDRVTRREDVWKIQNRVVVFDSVNIVPAVEGRPGEAPGWVQGSRGGKSDFVYHAMSKWITTQPTVNQS